MSTLRTNLLHPTPGQQQTRTTLPTVLPTLPTNPFSASSSSFPSQPDSASVPIPSSIGSVSASPSSFPLQKLAKSNSAPSKQILAISIGLALALIFAVAATLIYYRRRRKWHKRGFSELEDPSALNGYEKRAILNGTVQPYPILPSAFLPPSKNRPPPPVLAKIIANGPFSTPRNAPLPPNSNACVEKVGMIA